jgi:3-oxoacyl-[acyl-carrier-protein] synthase-3
MAFLRSFGSFLPDRVVTTAEAAGWVGATPESVFKISGIAERRFAESDMTVADLAVEAGKDCLRRAEIQPSEIGMLIVASGSAAAERAFPGPAAVAAHRLGIPGIPAIDLPMASAGSLYALCLAARLASQFGNILVIGSEKMSPIVEREPRKRGVAVLFGDGAGAALVSPDRGVARIVDSWLGSDGSYAADLCLEHAAPLSMNGRSVILQATRKIPMAIRTVLERASLSPGAVAVYLMHQANQHVIDRVAGALGVATARFFSNIRQYGNTSSASMLIAASEWFHSNTPPPGAPIVFAAFGAGFHWGALLARAV